MRRALLLAMLLAVPFLGRAQNAPVGQITFTRNDADLDPSVINRAECKDPPGTHTVQMNWNVGTAAGVKSYQLFASNQAFTFAAGAHCPTNAPSGTTATASWVAVGQVDSSATYVNNQSFDPVLIASALGASVCDLTIDTPIYLCVNANSATGPIAHVTGQMTLSAYPPDKAPTLTSVGSGDTALNPKWSDNGSTNTTWYRVQAVSMLNPRGTPLASWFDPSVAYTAFDPADRARHYSGYVSVGSRELRLGGLQNGVTYAVAVTGYTGAYNPATLDATGIGTGTPMVTYDLWEVYKQDGGRETGGCSSGLAGPAGLLFAAGALALARRRK